MWTPFLNFNLNYELWSYENIVSNLIKITINEEFYFWGVKGGGREGRLPQFEKFLKSSYRMVVPLHSKIFSTLAQLESV